MSSHEQNRVYFDIYHANLIHDFNEIDIIFSSGLINNTDITEYSYQYEFLKMKLREYIDNLRINSSDDIWYNVFMSLDPDIQNYRRKQYIDSLLMDPLEIIVQRTEESAMILYESLGIYQ